MSRGRRWTGKRAVGAWAVLTLLGAGLTLWLQQSPAPAEGTPQRPEPYGQPYGSPPPQPEGGCESLPPTPRPSGAPLMKSVVRVCLYTFSTAGDEN